MRTKFIITDDDKMVLFIQEKMLSNADLCQHPLKFSSGQDTLTYLFNNYNEADIFVIFLDINMPYMSGWEFLSNIEQLDADKKLKIFMVSSSIDQSDIDRANSCPLVIEYLVKPLGKEKLIELKEKYPFLKN